MVSAKMLAQVRLLKKVFCSSASVKESGFWNGISKDVGSSASHKIVNKFQVHLTNHGSTVCRS